MTSRRRPAPPTNSPIGEPPVVDIAASPERSDSAARPARRLTRTGQRPRVPHRPAAQQPTTPTPAAEQPAPVTSTEEIAGVVGDASATTTRGGEDVRRRGWFWHWNSIVTQYAPLIGLKGVGLLNSYTVWTDRRETSPHRGFAFPSQQREADFYGEDRAELITINKILVALDLIEIRKEMVPRTDERGRRWRVPHNFYRVKDHGDGFNLTTDAVLAVVALADRDRAVYRYVRRIFSPRFAPIDGENVWGAILDDLRQTDLWQRLAARTARDEDRASARSRAGHASRRATADPVFLLPTESDSATPEPPASDTINDSPAVETTTGEGTSVAKINTGLDPDVDGSNTGSAENEPSSVDPTSSGRPTNVAPSNRTYHQVRTTTTTERHAVNHATIDPGAGPGSDPPPDDTRDEATALVHFEESNARPSTPAERRLLRELARQFAPAADATGATGWGWLAAAIDDAVAAGSTFVAPRRLREILIRWEREGAPPEVAAGTRQGGHPTIAAAPTPGVGRSGESKRDSGNDCANRVDRARPVPPRTATPGEATRWGVSPGTADAGVEFPSPPSFIIEECGLTNRQAWSAMLDELRAGGDRASVDTWLRDAMIVGRGATGSLVIGVPHELARRRVADRFVTALRRAVTAVVGVALPVDIVIARDWLAVQSRQSS
ncbi:MAG: hypothetical protein H0W06_10415 [Chloroflexia bacterium]|nr:hypothetical protein [Chloroflexia bacterium]